MDVTACLLTRGDVDMAPIVGTLPGCWEVSVWDTSRPDEGVWGRYVLVDEARTRLVYLQDDDVVFERQLELLGHWRQGEMIVNWPHGDTPAGYDDCGLMHAGAIVERDLLLRAVETYLRYFPLDLDFRRDCDMAAGILTPHRYVKLPHHITSTAYRPNRMSHQPWQRETKMRVANRARAIRDHAVGPSRTDSMPTYAFLRTIRPR